MRAVLVRLCAYMRDETAVRPPVCRVDGRVGDDGEQTRRRPADGGDGTAGGETAAVGARQPRRRRARACACWVASSAARGVLGVFTSIPVVVVNCTQLVIDASRRLASSVVVAHDGRVATRNVYRVFDERQRLLPFFECRRRHTRRDECVNEDETFALILTLHLNSRLFSRHC